MANDDHTPKDSGTPAWKIWATIGAGVAAAAAVAAARAKKQPATASGGGQQGDGWGDWRSRSYGGAICSYHQVATTHKDGSEYWCPVCWRQSVNLFVHRW